MKINLLLQKTARHFVLLSALSVTAIAADAQTAGTNPPVDIQLLRCTDHQKFELRINNPAAEKLNITISGPEGTGFSDHTRSAVYRKRINMTEAQDGNYTITVVCNKKTFTKSILLQTTTTVNRDLSIVED